MFHTTTHHPTSAAEGLRGYGLPGIELGHRNQHRHVIAARDLQFRQVEARGLVSNLREMVGHAMVNAGIEIAGEQAVVPDRAIRATPSVS